MSGLSHITVLHVPRHVTVETQRFLQTVGRQSMEGLVLWVGTESGNEFQVTQLLIPRQRGIRTPEGVCAVVDSEEMYRINMELYKSEYVDSPAKKSEYRRSVLMEHAKHVRKGSPYVVSLPMQVRFYSCFL